MTARLLARALGHSALVSLLLAGCGDGDPPIDPPPEEDWSGCPTAQEHVADPAWTTTFVEAEDLVVCTTPSENNDARPIAEVFRQKLMLRLPAGTYRLPDEEESGPYTLPLCTRTEQGGAAQGIDVTGTINLGGATLALSGAFVPGSGQSFVLIDNDGAEAVSGTFAGLPNGGTVVFNGVSLTINRVEDAPAHCAFWINLIPHTMEHTTLGELRAGSRVNLEVDPIARYCERMLSLRLPGQPGA